MENMKTVLVAGVVALVMTLGVTFFVIPDNGLTGPKGDRGQDGSDGQFSAFPGPDFFGPINLIDRVTEIPAVFATTTGTAISGDSDNDVTLRESDFLQAQYNLVSIGGLATDADQTLTFPASSSLRTFLPKIGSRTEICWFNATTSDSHLIFAAGAGMDFRHASTSEAFRAVPSLFIEGAQELCIEFNRQPRDDGSTSFLGDITALLKFFEDSD